MAIFSVVMMAKSAPVARPIPGANLASHRNPGQPNAQAEYDSYLGEIYQLRVRRTTGKNLLTTLAALSRRGWGAILNRRLLKERFGSFEPF
jgi:hypothetical protein